MAFGVGFGTTTTDAAVLSLAPGTLRTQVFLEIERDVFHLERVLDCLWPTDNVLELPRLGLVDNLLAPFSPALAFAALAA